MSLQVWLPMTKDLRQQGLSNAEVINNGATYSSTGGKLGGCYSFNRSTPTYLKVNNPIITAENGVSITFWINLPSNASGNNQIVHIGNGPGWGNNRCTVFVRSGASYLIFSLSGGSDATSTRYTLVSSSLPLNTWTHVACVYSMGKAKIYLNGVLDHEYTISIIPSFNNTSYIGVGAAPNAGEGVTCSLNDVRIYNHCLSPMEVKELAKGLVLHYPLNRQGWGQENLLLNSNDLTLWPIESSGKIELQEDGYFKVSSKASNTTRYGIYYDFTFPEPNTYTFSVDVRDDWLIGVAPASTFTWTTANLSGTQGKKRISYTCTSTEENNKCRIYIAGTGTGGRVTYLKHPKLEKGSIATSWCPNSSDTLATTMGLNSTTEYDCSGFCNNGIKNNTPIYLSDTVKYSVSTHLNGTNQTIQMPDLSTLIKDEIFTFNIWFKRLQSEPSSKPWETIFGGPAGFEIETCSANNVHDNKIKAYSWGGSTFEFEFDKWNMLTLVRTASDSKFYLNGELKLTGSKGSIPSGNYFIGSWNKTTQQNYKGYVSDVRIYATALSASDVKALYNANKL